MKHEESRWRPVPHVVAPALLDLQQAWSRWAAGGDVPLRTVFDPSDFREALPWLMLVEILQQPNEFRPYDAMGRYIGTEIERYFAATNFTRVLLSTIGAPYAERWFRIHDDSIQSRQPCFYQGAPYRTGYDFIELELLTLPLSRTGITVDYIIQAMAPRHQ